jgi:hypothetical protein
MPTTPLSYFLQHLAVLEKFISLLQKKEMLFFSFSHKKSLTYQKPNYYYSQPI